jgi:hypothetical protein
MTVRCTVHTTALGNRFMGDLAELYACGLRDRGVDVRVAHDELPASDPECVDLIVAPHEFFAVGPALTPYDRDEILHRCAVLTTEQPGTPWFDLSVPLAAAAAATFDLSALGAAALTERGVAARRAPLGYHESIDAFGGDWSRPRPYDVTFLGGATPRRLSALSGLAEVLHHRESRLLLHDPRTPVVEDSPWFVSGRRRAELLANSRILVNIHRDERPYFEWVRILEAIANGATVLTEPSEGHEPLLPYDHFMPAGLDVMSAHLTALLRDDELRLEIARTAYEFVRTEHRLVDLLDPVVESLTELSSKHTTWFASELPPASESTVTSVPVLSEGDQLRRTLKGVALAQISLARRLDDLANATRPKPAEVDAEWATPGWHRVRPEVSVVVPVYRYRHVVLDAVRSVLASEGVTVEVILIEDHSSDGTREVLEGFLAEHPDAPVLAVFRARNGGLGAARNLGVERARADRCFFLDADNIVRPSALRKLSAALDANPSAAFSYSIIEVFGDEQSLLSHLPWSVERLVQQAYIDAMALVRTSTWLAVGGFREATEATIYGWEDYAFWLAIAQLGLDGVWVPEPLCRYRRHGLAMLSVTNLDTVTPMSYLRQEYPGLPWPP